MTVSTSLTPAASAPAPAVAVDEATLRALNYDLERLRRELVAEAGPADLAHLRKMARWSRACTALGLATAWLVPNPISVLLISQGKFSRWTMIGHHVLHRAYDRLSDAPGHRSHSFARGWRRLVDWFDWIDPEAWVKEHNLHHAHLGDELDPDKVEASLDWLRTSRAPRPVKLAVVAFFACTWKLLFWPANTLEELVVPPPRDATGRPRARRLRDLALFAARSGGSFASQLMRRSVLPYGLWTFVALPALFLPLGVTAAINVLITLVLAEILTNIHSFVMLVTNHSGADIPRFSGNCADKREFALRQIVGSVNFTTGGDLHDFLHGFLNYQIEHHVWPNMTMLQLRRAQPRLAAICARHGVPYRQESVLRRLRETVAVMIGDRAMTTVSLRGEAANDHDATQPQLREVA